MEHFVVFHAPINTNTTQNLIATFSQMVTIQNAQVINLLLSTPGGEVASGMTLYNFLRGLPITVNTHNIGNVDSIGNAIFLAGKNRKACPHSTFMFHGVGINANNLRLEEKNIRETLHSILADQKRIADVITDATQISTHDVGQLFREASTKDADFALNNGIIHSIEDLNIPHGSPIVSLVVN